MALNLTVLSCRAIHLPLMCHMTMAQVSLQSALNGFFHLKLAFSEFAKLIFSLCWVPDGPQNIEHLESN